MLKINNLSKRFFLPKSLKESLFYPFKKNKEILALDNINLELEKGQILALLGPNGAGKTTLIKILCTLILPDKGTVHLSGYDLIKQPEYVKSKIGLVLSEERGFYPRLSGRQNLEFFSTLFNLSRKQIKERIEHLSSLLEIDDIDKPFQDYSSGMKQRIALSRCLISEPEIIFLDEPCHSLDPASSHKIKDFIKNTLVKEMGKTILFSTHQTQEAEYLADKLAILNKGKIKAFGSREEINRSWGFTENTSLEEAYLKMELRSGQS